jgi:sugar (pentulose or hexulose) kinase
LHASGTFSGYCGGSGVNDNVSSAIGAGPIVDLEPAAVMGTSGYLALMFLQKTDCSMGTMPSGIKGRYLFWGEMANNGKVLESYLKNLIYAQDCFDTGEIPIECTIASRVAAQVPPGSEGVIFYHGLMARCLQEDPYMRGGFLNLSHATSQAHLTRGSRSRHELAPAA